MKLSTTSSSRVADSSDLFNGSLCLLLVHKGHEAVSLGLVSGRVPHHAAVGNISEWSKCVPAVNDRYKYNVRCCSVLAEVQCQVQYNDGYNIVPGALK